MDVLVVSTLLDVVKVVIEVVVVGMTVQLSLMAELEISGPPKDNPMCE